MTPEQPANTAGDALFCSTCQTELCRDIEFKFSCPKCLPHRFGEQPACPRCAESEKEAERTLKRFKLLQDCRDSVIKERDDLKAKLQNLLCRIHRDGGHYLQAHGLDKAWQDADEIVARLNAEHDKDDDLKAKCEAMEKALREIHGITMPSLVGGAGSGYSIALKCNSIANAALASGKK